MSAASKLQIAIVIFKVLVEKGVPAVIALLNAWEAADPSLEDIDKLHDLVKRPESY